MNNNAMLPRIIRERVYAADAYDIGVEPPAIRLDRWRAKVLQDKASAHRPLELLSPRSLSKFRERDTDRISASIQVAPFGLAVAHSRLTWLIPRNIVRVNQQDKIRLTMSIALNQG